VLPIISNGKTHEHVNRVCVRFYTSLGKGCFEHVCRFKRLE